MMSDHPDDMGRTEFRDVLLPQLGTDFLYDGADPIANRIACPNGHRTWLMAGFEDALLPVAMKRHLAAANGEERVGLYNGDGADLINRLRTEAGGMVFIPHTESRTVEKLIEMSPDGIEIYNIHANMDPKIRQPFLGLDHFAGLPDLMVFWIDPYHEQEPDLSFLTFMRTSRVYFDKWNSLFAAGKKVSGIGATDSHENTLKWKDRNDERLDSNRRMMRWMSNHYLVTERTTAAIEDAVKKGRGWVVFEGLGTPVGMDFHANTSGTIANMGDAMTLQAGTTRLYVALPTLHSGSPQDDRAPTITVRLRHVSTGGVETTVAEATGRPIVFAPTQPGAYRAEVSIVARHLHPFIKYKRDELLGEERTWVITNPLYLE